ncbi:MAG TPA: BPSS1780 family membrane protein [Burkholderiaceae bacterium]
MKLNIVPARTGIQWVREGVKTFFSQPLALIGLFFMYMAVMLIVSQLPAIGVVLAGVLVPASTLGLMAATREASSGKFPMPTVLVSAFRAGQQRLKAMLQLGVIYTALSLLASFLVSLLVPAVPPTGAQAGEQISGALLLTLLLHMPLFLMFWHAPALVHWHGISPVKSLFFSVVACLRNTGAFLVYGLAWGALVMVLGLVIALFASMMGSAQMASTIMMPFAFLMAAMMSTSIYFTFRDCFVADESADAAPVEPPALP